MSIISSKDTERTSSLPGLWRYPSNRDIVGKGGLAWLEGRRQDDGAEGLWRVHDTLYDLSKFMDRHPGGEEWLRLTKGTDITEAFEVHHITDTPKEMLSKFRVKSAETLRNSPYSFLHEGFYLTLRRRVFALLPEPHLRGLSLQSRILADALVFTLMLSTILTALFQSVLLACIAGILLGMNTIAAHNFLHLKDHWRRFYFDLGLMSSTHWRITHALSHHLFPNSLQDLEVSIPEPILQWLPRDDKTFYARFISWVVSPIVYVSFFPLDCIFRVFGSRGVVWTDLLGLVLPLTMLITTGFTRVYTTMLLWLVIIFAGGLYFGITGINAGHHHPDVFHDGDMAREDRDWGLAQLDTNRDREGISGVKGSVDNAGTDHPSVNIDSASSNSLWTFFLVMTNFGHHTLHHLFPTIDHAHLYQLYPVLEQTLTEFGVPYQTHSVLENIKGQFLQLTKNQPNPLPPKSFNAKKKQ